MEKQNNRLMQLIKLNPSLNIISVNDSSFEKYGKILNLNCEKDLIKKMEEDTEIPQTGNVYVPYVRNWENKNIINELSQYYEEKIELGYCNGQNVMLNALEWHNCNEIDVFATDALLFLAKTQDLENYQLNSNQIKAFFVEKGTSVLLYNDTLHFSPCKTEKTGFKTMIILSDQTNTDLEENTTKPENYLDSLLLKKNKYIICHKEAENLTKQGVKANIIGENFCLNI